jgi:hypothetical protein
MFIRYGDFYDFYYRNKSKRKIEADEFIKLNKLPKPIKIDSLDKYLD